MPIYRAEGLRAYAEFEAALAEEHEVVHELAQCAKIDAYNLVASDIFERVRIAHEKMLATYETIESFKQ